MIISDDFVHSLEPVLEAGGRHGLPRHLFDRIVALYEEAGALSSEMDVTPDAVTREAAIDSLHETLDTLERETPP